MTSGKTFPRLRDVEFSFDGLGTASTCRVQVFTMRGETVVLATQRLERDGTSLVNAQEQAVDAVTAQLLDGHGPQRWYQVLIGDADHGGGPLQLVAAVSGLERTAEFTWSPVTVEELSAQLGHRPDLTRGVNALPVPVSPAAPPDRFQVVAPLLLPAPSPWQGGECMTPRSRARWVKALVRRPGSGVHRPGAAITVWSGTLRAWRRFARCVRPARTGLLTRGRGLAPYWLLSSRVRCCSLLSPYFRIRSPYPRPGGVVPMPTGMGSTAPAPCSTKEFP